MRGELHIGSVLQAYDALCVKYPILCTYLDRVGDDFVITEIEPPHTGVTVRAGDVDAPMADVDLNHSTALAGLDVVLDGELSAVTLIVHHSVGDAYHALAILEDFWRLYHMVEAGHETDEPSHGYPESFEKLMADRGVVGTGNDGPTEGPLKDSTSGEPRGVTAPIVRYTLSEQQTTALAAYGHAQGTTIHGLVSAAILRAESDVRGVPLTGIPYAYSADLRSRVEPPIAATAGTNVLGYAIFLSAGTAATTTELAREVNSVLRTGLADGTVLQSGLDPEDMPTDSTSMSEGSIFVEPPVVATNWGTIPSFVASEGIHFEDFVGYVHVVSDETAPSFGSNTYLISTFSGRLGITIGVFDPDSADRQVVAIDKYLAELTS